MKQIPFNVTDSSLPELSQMLDDSIMSEHFNKVLQDTQIDQHSLYVTSCKKNWTKYKAGRSCMVCYQLHIENLKLNQSFSLLLTARMYHPGESSSRYKKALREENIETRIFPGIFRIHELSLVVWSFPNDRKLKHIDTLDSEHEYLHNAIESLALQRWGSGWMVSSFTSHPIHYVPEHAYSIRVEISLQHKKLKQRKNWTIFGKTYYDDQGELTFKQMQSLTSAQTSGRSSVKTAIALQYEPNLKLLWQQGLSGESLNGIQWMQQKQQLRQAVSAVQNLHSTTLQGLPSYNLDELTQSLQQRSEIIAKVVPEYQDQLQTVVERLFDYLPNLKNSHQVTLHGDLHPQNLFAHNDQIALIDLDQLKRGPASVDLGSWMACCMYHSSMENQNFEQAMQQAMLFIKCYTQLSTSPPSWHEIVWFTVAALIEERLYRCQSRLKGGRLELIPVLLEWADLLSRSTFELELHRANGV